MSHINVRVPEHMKQDLDFLAKVLDVNVSELIREIVVPLSRLSASIKAVRTLEVAEKMVTRLIIEMPEFQELLKELEKHIEVVAVSCGYGGERRREVASLFGMLRYNVVKDGKYYYPVVLAENQECNEFWHCWRSEHMPFVERRIETLGELADFLEDVSEVAREKIDEKIEEIKEAMKRLLK